ncbi:N-acetylmuramoyl-L-alanine amidase [Pseudoruegeria sp. SHC-113]|uniref:N-acetylmuramoyl-L-alanine amidase n=1 Tax=Pseudoruegeria sp. SHC-113 TaxID=2855439 RepID=UPI0021BAA17B|nr:N-acetylmuramoyl-L-alanine amidase [Pseudoruegeria sp. SHC-113]
MQITPFPSPNFGERRGAAQPDLIVLHYTAMQSCDAARDRLCDPAFEVSAHYLIGRDGACLRLVEEDKRAWHAGAGRWGDVVDVNSRSIGIELDNDGASPFSAPQMATLEALLPEVMRRWGIPPARVIGHSDMAPARKIDPGPRFDWRRLALQGLSVWPEPAAPGDLYADLARFGYDPEAPREAVLAAFRARFRPGADGSADAEDAGLAADLAARFAVDRTGALT